MEGFDANLLNTLVSLAIGLFTLGGILFGIYLRFRARIREWKKLGAEVLAAVAQVPNLISDTASFKGEITRLSGIANRVQGAVLPNGGSSIPDRLDAMAKQSEARGVQLAEHGNQITSIGKKVDAIANTQRATQNANPRVATFETDDKGRCVYANRTYLRWTGLSLAEVLGWGWINAIHPADRERVRKAWAAAVADSIRFQDRYRMVHSDGVTVFEVDGSAEAIPENVIPAERWVGLLVRVEVAQQS